MTDDIVTRLRDEYGLCECSGINHDCDRCETDQQAADEIEKLRRDSNSCFRQLLNTQLELGEKQDEIERLRTIIRDYYLTEKEYESCREQNDIVYLEDQWKAAWKALEVEALRRDTW